MILFALFLSSSCGPSTVVRTETDGEEAYAWRLTHRRVEHGSNADITVECHGQPKSVRARSRGVRAYTFLSCLPRVHKNNERGARVGDACDCLRREKVNSDDDDDDDWRDCRGDFS